MHEKTKIENASENDQKVIEDELKKSAKAETQSSKSHGKILAEQVT